MKKIKLLLLAAVMALALTSCRQQEQADFSALSEVLTDRKGQHTYVTFTGNGLIYHDLSATHYYLDYETMTEIPLCPDPNCEHGANYYKNQRGNYNCGAHYFEGAFYYNGKMYFTERKWKKRGTVEQDSFLCCADIDGQNRRTIATFEDYDFVQGMYRYENILYFFLNYPIWGDSDKSDNIVPKDLYLCVVDLSAGNVIYEEKIFDGSDEKSIGLGFLGFDQEGYVYYCINSFPDSGEPMKNEGNWRCKPENGSLKIESVTWYDKIDGDWRVIFDWQEKIFSARYKNLTVRMTFNVSRVSSFIHENRLYFWHYQEPDLYYLDGETGTVYIAENCLEMQIAGIHQSLCDVYGDYFIFSDCEGGNIFSKRSMSEFDFHEYEGEYERTYS